MPPHTTDDFAFDLPAQLIAEHPVANRTQSRLLHISATGDLADTYFHHLPNLLRDTDLLVLNNSKVIRARLHGHKDGSGGQVEVMLERVLDEHHALARVKASKPPKEGKDLCVGTYRLRVEQRQGEFFVLSLVGDSSFEDLMQDCGEFALPPYIKRDVCQQDTERYQTVYAQSPGSVAAPTAGLHFDQALLEEIHSRGIATATLTLHIGSGTYQPVRSAQLDEHRMHTEWFEVEAFLCDAIAQCRARGGRVIAVGTTVVRALETLASRASMKPSAMETDIFIYPGFQFQVVDAMLTNFHLPRSTLLMLVCAFAGYARTMSAYRHAVEQSYRFFSYGDAMFLEKPK